MNTGLNKSVEKLISKDKHRLYFYVNSDEYNQLKYFLTKYSDRYDSTGDFIQQAIQHYIQFLNGDYKLPSLEQMRLNQMIDGYNAVVSSNNALIDIITSGFNSLMHITRGDNYLINDSNSEDGVL